MKFDSIQSFDEYIFATAIDGDSRWAHTPEFIIGERDEFGLTGTLRVTSRMGSLVITHTETWGLSNGILSYDTEGDWDSDNCQVWGCEGFEVIGDEECGKPGEVLAGQDLQMLFEVEAQIPVAFFGLPYHPEVTKTDEGWTIDLCPAKGYIATATKLKVSA